MLFSVVIPTYNRAHLLAHTLDSVWQQRFPDYEVIVVDDGSNDETRRYLNNLSNKVRVIRQENRGPGAARNMGVRQAHGDYVAFLDSDDLWFPWTLDAFARAIREHGYPDILSGSFREFTDATELFDVREGSYAALWFPDYLASSPQSYSIGSGTCALRGKAAMSFLEDRLNGEDHDLVLQMGVCRGFVRIAAPVTLAWRRHPQSETGDFTSNILGALRLVVREKSGTYPGGSERSRERRRIIGRHTRPVALACLRKDALKQGWKLYRATLKWNLQLGQWKYVLGFPILALLAFLSRAFRAHHKGIQ